MRINKTLTTCEVIGKVGFGILGWAVRGAAVGATGAGLCGVLYATMICLIHGDMWRLASIGLYFAVCGAVAGALAGGFARLIDSEDVADHTNRLPHSTRQRDAVF